MKHHILSVLYFISMAILSNGALGQKGPVSSGGLAQGSSGTVTYSIGQIDYQSFSGVNGSVHEGLQQPFEFYEVGISESNSFPEIALFPNPATNEFTIEVSDMIGQLNYQLHDAKGGILKEGLLDSKRTTVEIAEFPSSAYLLNIIAPDKKFKTYKVIKNH